MSIEGSSYKREFEKLRLFQSVSYRYCSAAAPSLAGHSETSPFTSTYEVSTMDEC